MRVVIAGGRDYILTEDDFAWLDSLHEQHKFTEVVSGGCRGADAGGESWAISRGIPVRKFLPDWSHGLCAGPMRNARMADYADMVVLFPGGKGTRSMQLLAQERAKPIHYREPA